MGIEHQDQRPGPEILKTSEQAAAYLRISLATLRRRTDLPIVRIGRRRFYRQEDLEEFLRGGGNQ